MFFQRKYHVDCTACRLIDTNEMNRGQIFPVSVVQCSCQYLCLSAQSSVTDSLELNAYIKFMSFIRLTSISISACSVLKSKKILIIDICAGSNQYHIKSFYILSKNFGVTMY